MHVLLYIAGAFLVAFGSLDALWTTLWVDGNAGPLTRRHNSWLRLAILKVANGRHRVLSITGPLVLVTSAWLWNPRSGGPSWGAEVQAARVECDATPAPPTVAVPTTPDDPGWFVTIPCGRLRS